jgi:hypothetical protein
LQEEEDEGLKGPYVPKFVVEELRDGRVVGDHVLRGNARSDVAVGRCFPVEERLLGGLVADMVHPELLLEARLAGNLGVDPAGQLRAVLSRKVAEFDEDERQCGQPRHGVARSRAYHREPWERESSRS